jgi:hypothetical protein
MSLIGLLVLLIIVGVLFWAVSQLSAAFAIPPPIVVVIQVLLVVIVVLYLLQAFGLWAGGPTLRLR